MEKQTSVFQIKTYYSTENYLLCNFSENVETSKSQSKYCVIWLHVDINRIIIKVYYNGVGKYRGFGDLKILIFIFYQRYIL